jgi:molybdopterin synthase sulfur carrier subunit
MKVYVKLFATLIRSVPDALRARYPEIRSGTPLTIELPEGSTLADLVADLGLPREEVKVMFVNGRAQESDYCLSDKDEVGIFPPIGGG